MTICRGFKFLLTQKATHADLFLHLSGHKEPNELAFLLMSIVAIALQLQNTAHALKQAYTSTHDLAATLINLYTLRLPKLRAYVQPSLVELAAKFTVRFCCSIHRVTTAQYPCFICAGRLGNDTRLAQINGFQSVSFMPYTDCNGSRSSQ